MKNHTIIVDGYNVIYRVPRFKAQLDRSLQSGREALLRFCSEWKARRRDVDRFYVVFDGDSSVQDGDVTASAPGVRALYSKTGETADRRIRLMLDQAERNQEITVVSDDNEVRDSARVNHMRSISVLEFARTGGDRATETQASPSETEKPLPPAARKAITDELRNLWSG